MPAPGRDERLRRYWNKHASSYDKQMGFADRHFFGDTRHWVCSKASGQVLEVAIGTGLNLPHYPDDVHVTGVEWSPATLDLAGAHAHNLGRDVDRSTRSSPGRQWRSAPYLSSPTACGFAPSDHSPPEREARPLHD